MYGLSWIVFAAQIACCTGAGAAAGAAAVPSGRSLATVLGTVSGAGAGTGPGNAAPPLGSAPGVWAEATDGRTSMDDVSSARADARRENKPYSSFVGLRG